MRPRYVVSSLTGVRINPARPRSSAAGKRNDIPTVYFVHDRLRGYAVVASYDRTVGHAPGRGAGQWRDSLRLRHAERRAAELSAEHDAWLASADAA